MIILFKYCADVENYESFIGFGYIYIYIYIYNDVTSSGYVNKKSKVSIEI